MRIADRMYCVFTGNPFLVTAPLSWRDRIRLRLFLLHMLLMRLRESKVLCVFVVCVRDNFERRPVQGRAARQVPLTICVLHCEKKCREITPIHRTL